MSSSVATSTAAIPRPRWEHCRHIAIVWQWLCARCCQRSQNIRSALSVCTWNSWQAEMEADVWEATRQDIDAILEDAHQMVSLISDRYVHAFLRVMMSLENGLWSLLAHGLSIPFPFCPRSPAVELDILVVIFEMEASTDRVLGTMEPEQGDRIYAYRRCLHVHGGRRRTCSVSSPYFICSGNSVSCTKKS